MGGNPIGPYGDLKGNYKNVIQSNMLAVKQLLEYSNMIKMISEESVKVFSKFDDNQVFNSDDGEYKIKMELLDHIYIELMEKVKMLNKQNAKENNKEGHENR